MKRNNLIFFIIFFLGMSSFVFGQINKKNVATKEYDYVPDKETAIRIAEAIWLPIYGNKIYSNKPFVAKLVDSTVWIVEGTLNKSDSAFISKGGVPYIEIQKSDCKILKVTHGK